MSRDAWRRYAADRDVTNISCIPDSSTTSSICRLRWDCTVTPTPRTQGRPIACRYTQELRHRRATDSDGGIEHAWHLYCYASTSND